MTKNPHKIGNYEALKQRAGNKEPMKWLNEYVSKLNNEHKTNSVPIIIKKYENKQLEKDYQRLFNGGYLFLQDIYYKLGLNKICDEITDRHHFKFDCQTPA